MLWFRTHHNCPMCKRPLRTSNLHDITIKPQEAKLREEVSVSMGSTQKRVSPKKTAIYSEFSDEKLAEIQNIEIRPPGFTTKVDALVRHVLWLRESDPGAKSIIFSQYVTFVGL
jgi:E3 ubiquitin-protein ligase SHPRH